MSSALPFIVAQIHKLNGFCLAVGGCVRDHYLGLIPKDLDIEVYGINQAQLESILSQFGRVNNTGVSFGVTKLTTESGEEYDFSLPRRDNKVGIGHKGFSVDVCSDLTPEQAAFRRDYTINSMGRNLLTGELHDHYNGLDDLKHGLLRATSCYFTDDPLRVLRGFQFAARFKMNVATETAWLCRSIKHTFSELPKERVFQEWVKWATKSVKPSLGLQFLVDTQWIECFPEINALIGVQQDKEWHPEGDAFIHTGIVCDEMNDICNRENLSDESRIVFMLAALCHDFGKAKTTIFENGRWRSPGHDDESVPLTKSFLESIGCFPSLAERIIPLVAEHMAHVSILEPNPRIVRRLAHRLGCVTINELSLLVEADHNGRPPLPKCIPSNFQLIHQIAQQLDLEKNKPVPIVMGRHLIQLGLKPGPIFSQILDRCFELQLDGVFNSIESGLVVAAEVCESFADNLSVP